MPGQRKALIIASDTYEHRALHNLRAPAADAEALGRVLSDPKIGDFDVEVVHNEPAHVIQVRVEGLLTSARADDVLLLHFSCHGLKDEFGDLFFAATNTFPDMLGSTTVPAEFVQRYMQRSRSRDVVLLLDCCYGGAFPAGATVRSAGEVDVLDSFPQERPNTGRSRVVISATTAMQFALEGDQLVNDQRARPSVFTTALVTGLTTGEADLDEDGWVSVRELYEYVLDKVREHNPNQTPTASGDLAGRLYLTRSQRRRVRPLPLPFDLHAAMDGDRFARLGAVSELQSLLIGDNLPAAAGAHDALVKLTADDSRAVAESAREALKDAVIQPSPPKVDFGRVRQRSSPPHQSVQLLGPPVARACAPHPSHEWIRVDQEDGGLDISIDTSVVGARHGSIALKGPTGETAITVDVEFFSPPPPPPSRVTRKIHEALLAAVVAVLLGIGALIWIVLPGGPARVHSVISYSGGHYQFHGPEAIVADGTDVWVVNNTSDSVTELDARDGRLEQTISGSSYQFNAPGAIAADKTHLWVANAGSDSVTELDAGDGRLERAIPGVKYGFTTPEAIAADNTHVWVANYSGNSVTELNVSDGSLVQVMVGSKYQFNIPAAITSDGTHVWVANNVGNSVTELNAGNGSLIRVISGSRYQFSAPRAITSDGTHVWVANTGGNSVTELVASNGSLVRAISGHNYHFNVPGAIAAEGSHVWVANSGGNSVTELPTG